MGCCTKFLLLVTLGVAVGLGYFLYSDEVQEKPHLPDDDYWGKGKPRPDDAAVRPFKIEFTDTVVKDLLRRLGNTRELTPPLEGVGFGYGTNSDYLKGFLNFWRTEYNFKERQDFLNQYPHFKTRVSGLDIHFMRVAPDQSKLNKDVEVVPLLLLHGWPGSVREFYEMIPMLTTPRADEDFVFEVIAPSLPGYGFSEGTTKPGLGAGQMAVIMNKLMNKIGFKKYYVQGGDWGSVIGNLISVLYPESVIAYHSNMCSVGNGKLNQLKFWLSHLFPSLFAEEGFEDKFRQQPSFFIEESGYFHIQATKPDTIGVGLNDSPAGLASYILEKFSTATNSSWRSRPDGGLQNWNKVHLADNLMFYWATSSITTAVRLYAETFNRNHYALGLNVYPVKVPTGCARFPEEVVIVPRPFLQSIYPNLIRLTDMPKGGHFAAFEVPELLAEDVWQFVSTVRRIVHNAK